MKKILAIALLSSSWGSSSYALNFLDKIAGMQNMNIHRTSAPTHKLIELEKYTDFTNNWKGSCVSNNHDTHDITLSIKNDEETISFDGIEYDLNTLSTRSSAGDWGSDFTHVIMRWNENGDQLIINYTTVDNTNGMESFYSSIGKDTITLMSGQLIIKNNYQQFHNGIVKNVSSETCTLSPVE